MPNFRLIATAAFGLESVVARELEALGYESRADRPGWLAFDGDESDVARANLNLRASDRVLIELSAFPAPDFDALFDSTRAVAWESLLPANARVPVRGRSVKSTLASVPACQSIVKKAIVERLKSRHRVSTLAEDGPSFPVEVALLKDEAKLLLDTSGAGLHKRGYRPESGVSPLKETLAAGLVLLSFWNRDRPFLDPFCGTGTIAIEAALIGRNRAPGLERRFAAESWSPGLRLAFELARREARRAEKPPSGVGLLAFDRDADALRVARQSAKRASVAEDIRFERKDFADVSSRLSHGCLITNPPYGERSGEAEEVRELYRSMPEMFRRLPTWSFYVLTAKRDFERALGQTADRRRKLFNGDLECTYFQFYGPKPGATDSLERAFGGTDDRAQRQAEIFRNRLKKRAHHLRKWPAKRATDCYRLYDRDIKEVPLVVDRFGDGVLLTPTSLKIESRTRAEHEDWLDLMAKTAADVLGVAEENVFVAGRRREGRPFVVREDGIVFEAVLPGPPAIDPGLRAVRRWLRENAAGKRVLVFDSTLAVAAARGGASSTTTIASDASARRPFELNDVPLDSHRFVPRLERAGESDVAVCEAPLPEGLEQHITPSGVLLLLARDPKTKLGPDVLTHWSAEEVTADTIPEEFRGKPHRAWRLTRSQASTSSLGSTGRGRDR